VRMLKFARVLVIGLTMLAVPAWSAPATVAWLRDGKVEVRSLSTGGAPAGIGASSSVPLGSLWKLFVYAYLIDTNATEVPYVCVSSRSAAQDEERYCCEPGESVQRDAALARSCAPYFSPQRLRISAPDWNRHWSTHGDLPWLRDLNALQPETEVTLDQLLRALMDIPVAARIAARTALLQTGIEGYGRAAWPSLGAGIRYKTYSWHRKDGSAFGGAAGWLVDGTPFWFGATGSSKTALAAWAAPLARSLPAVHWHEAGHATGDASCVDVDFFARYPLRAVWQANASIPVRAGDLHGDYQLEFFNGNWLRIASTGQLQLGIDADQIPRINGRFTINDYVARVVDREGNASSPQAARALAISARSYLFQNASFESGCWHIADSSRTQRVSPNAATDAALDAAWFTDDIILSGVAVRYHSESAAPNRLAWRDALTHTRQGWDFERILQDAYPDAQLATVDGHAECRRLAAAETWLTHAIVTWRRRLNREPGFEDLERAPNVCALSAGNPYSDQQGLRIYVRGWQSVDERITLAHEYLHLSLRFHPNGVDEAFIERLARQLIES